MDDSNPHGVCTWGEEALCEGCGLRGALNCRWDWRLLLGFAALILPFGASSVAVFLVAGSLTGNWLPPAAYFVLLAIFLTVVETRILCSHCPFYARAGWTIRCHANHGFPRLWRYRPGSMNAAERVSLISCFLFFLAFPAVTGTWGIGLLYWRAPEQGPVGLLGLAYITAVNLASAASFIILLGVFYCTRCVNFSCPFNRISEAVRREYLAMNPVLEEAWRRNQ